MDEEARRQRGSVMAKIMRWGAEKWASIDRYIASQFLSDSDNQWNAVYSNGEIIKCDLCFRNARIMANDKSFCIDHMSKAKKEFAQWMREEEEWTNL